MKYLTGVYWERGSTAKSNQDAVVLLQVLTARGRVMMAAVCDGMGGLAQGEVASGYVTRRLQEWFYESLLYAMQKRKPYWVIRRSLDRLVYHMQEQLQQYGSREKLSLGTTMTVLVLWEKVYLIWHLGDSRIYRMNGTGRRGRERAKTAEAVCLTKDHARGKHVLTKCVGSFGYERPDFCMGRIGGSGSVQRAVPAIRPVPAGGLQPDDPGGDGMVPAKDKGHSGLHERRGKLPGLCVPHPPLPLQMERAHRSGYRIHVR